MISRAVGDRYAVLNPAYPAAYWQVAISTDLKVGEVIPLHVLERDIVLWRDSAGQLHASSAHCGHLGAHLGYGGEVVDDTLRCPFHAWRYNASGKVVDIPGVTGRVTTRACLQIYRVIERYGAVFLWNGPSIPDFEMPDALAELGLAEDAVDFVNVRFKLWYSARQLLENNPDASHFAGLHGLGTWGDADLVERTDTKMDVIARFYDRTPYPRWSNSCDPKLSPPQIIQQFANGGAGTVRTPARITLRAWRRIPRRWRAPP